MNNSNYDFTEDLSLSLVEESKADYNKVGTDKESESLNEKEINFKYQLLKGRIAENLIQELFLSEGYQVNKFGIENNHPFLLQQIKGLKSKQSLSLRNAPDLIIFDPTKHKERIHYAEVKYCGSSFFKLNSMINVENYINCYPNTLFFIVSNEGIFIVDIDKFKDSKIINLLDEDVRKKYLISENPYFKLRPKVIEQFEELSSILFSDIPKRV